MSEIAMQAVGLVRRIEGAVSHTLVNGIDLAVNKGEFVAITGPSGSGKSSLLYLLGLLDAPSEGEVIICGQPTSKLSENDRAQVRLIVEAALPVAAAWHGMSPRERARELFTHYRVWDTEENCGVLVYVNLADRQVEIVADRGVGKTVSAHDWHAACRVLTHGFAEGKFREGTLAALAQINILLERHYPGNGGSTNELPDNPVML